MTPLVINKPHKNCGNITTWIIIIIITLLFSAFATYPVTKKWLDLQSRKIELKEMNLNYEEELSRKTAKLDSISKEFDKIAKDFLKEEKILFPQSLNVRQIAKMLELYSLQYSLISNNSLFELNSISFSTTNSENYTKTSASLSISSSKESLKDFVYFIQKNKLPQKLIDAQNSSVSLLKNDISATQFIEDNQLPIANIESIVSTEDSETPGLLNTEIQINFFSQKTTNDGE
jgi:hypothetical protein